MLYSAVLLGALAAPAQPDPAKLPPPTGDRIAYFSDRRQFTDVYVMSALDSLKLAFSARSSTRSATLSPPG